MNATVDYNTLTIILGGLIFWTGTIIAVMLWLNTQFNKIHFRLIKVELRLDMMSGKVLTPEQARMSNEF